MSDAVRTQPVRRFGPATAIALSILLSVPSAGAQVLVETFEDGLLDARIAISTVGTFGLAPGIQALPNFGSTRAFGFGTSTCGANCFGNFATRMNIVFAAPTPVGTIQFKEMELYGNWGSNGIIAVDGVALTGATADFGRLPYNDLVADTTFRTWSFPVNRTISSIVLNVFDITGSSQIAIDDLTITAVPELPASSLLLGGLAALAWRIPHRRSSPRPRVAPSNASSA